MSAVLIDRNARTAILVANGRTLTRLVPLEEGPLLVRALTEQQMRDRGFRPIDYPIKRAARLYLRHAGGVSEKARKALRAVAKGAA